MWLGLLVHRRPCTLPLVFARMLQRPRLRTGRPHVRRDDGSYLATSRGISAVIPSDHRQWRNSPEGRIHVCIRNLKSGSEHLVCAFRGPGA
ncbi:MAG: hypothetical protein AB7O44_18040 [Hyphomicrobiaceae bacterium]